MGLDNLGENRILKGEVDQDVSNIRTEDGSKSFSYDLSTKAAFDLQTITLLNSWTYNLAILDFSGIKSGNYSSKGNDTESILSRRL